MQKILMLFLVLLSLNVSASKLRVQKILPPSQFSESYLVFVSSGEVYELEPSKLETLSDLKWAKETNVSIDISLNNSKNKNLDKRKAIKEVKLFNDNRDYKSKNDLEIFFDNEDRYIYTEFESSRDIKSLFYSFERRHREDSQCYNRAHIWVYNAVKEAAPKTLNLGKMWVFFSDKYIEEHEFKWWFHVAPFTYKEGSKEPYILDRKYTRKPRNVNRWLKRIMTKRAECKRIIHYHQYFTNLEEDCFTLRTNMYYYQPYQIEALGKGGPKKTMFLDAEIELATKDVWED